MKSFQRKATGSDGAKAEAAPTPETMDNDGYSTAYTVSDEEIGLRVVVHEDKARKTLCPSESEFKFAETVRCPHFETARLGYRDAKNRRTILVGLISFYALESAMMVREKGQVSLEGLKGGTVGLGRTSFADQ
jgi:hypothetical protein